MLELQSQIRQNAHPQETIETWGRVINVLTALKQCARVTRR